MIPYQAPSNAQYPPGSAPFHVPHRKCMAHVSSETKFKNDNLIVSHFKYINKFPVICQYNLHNPKLFLLQSSSAICDLRQS